MIGKIAGTVFGLLLVRHFIGGIIGFAIGHLFDRALQRIKDKGNVEAFLTSGDSKQSVFFYTTFSVMGHVAKASGRVTPEHIQTATDFMTQMRLSDSQVEEAKSAFREGKLIGFPLKKKLRQFKSQFSDRKDLCQFFLEIQIQTAYCDDVLEQAEYDLLVKVAKQLGFNKRQLQQLIAMWEAEIRFQTYKKAQQEKYKKYDRRQQYREHQEQQRHQQQSASQNGEPSLLDAYALLGVGDRDSVRDIKRAYKRLMAQNHPDKLVAKGLPPEMMEVAKQKTQDIQAAYEIVKKARKF